MSEYNLPEGNNHFLDDDDIECEECGRIDDVNNGEYFKKRWYCDSCFKELFKECKVCGKYFEFEDDELICDECRKDLEYLQ